MNQAFGDFLNLSAQDRKDVFEATISQQQGMMLGNAPEFKEIIETLSAVEIDINRLP